MMTMETVLAITVMETILEILNGEGGLWENIQGGDQNNNQTQGLNKEAFAMRFSGLSRRPNGDVDEDIVTEGSKTIGNVIIEPLTLVQHLMHSVKWRNFFPCIIADELPYTPQRNQVHAPIGYETEHATILMEANFQVLTPLVKIRQTKFTRTAVHLNNGDWLVYDFPTNDNQQLPFIRACLVQNSNTVPGASTVTWVDIALYRQVASDDDYLELLDENGRGFGSLRWFQTLARECRRPSIYSYATADMKDQDKRFTVLAQRMTRILCLGISWATPQTNSRKRIGERLGVSFGTSAGDHDEEEGDLNYLTAVKSELVNAPYGVVFEYIQSIQHPRLGANIFHVPFHDTENYVGLYVHEDDPDRKRFLRECFKDASGAMLVTSPITTERLNKTIKKWTKKNDLVLDSVGYVVCPAGAARTLVTVAYQLNFTDPDLPSHDVEGPNGWMDRAANDINQVFTNIGHRFEA
ncbi:homeobox-leucine zipper protein ANTHOCYANINLESS 2-like [Eutrema salsugineum]|uniref:homeobox-leucine zipper protein ANTHOCYANINLESS 2-like n=1 Tax=Eutrema salsugineum TaxID=72664 RepID=UPI000CECF4EB|nr:homeobox-leucine zipper protein ANTHOCYANINLESS 2-like [Eutrema salsugineum]